MENCNAVSHATLTTTNTPEVPFYSEEEQSDSEKNFPDVELTTTTRKRGIPLYTAIIAFLVIMLLMSAIQMHQHRLYSEAIEKEAYLLSVTINLLEDNMMMQYGVFPEEVGLDGLRSAWISNPCHETAMAYYEALSSFFEQFEQYTEPSFDLELIQV